MFLLVVRHSAADMGCFDIFFKMYKPAVICDVEVNGSHSSKTTVAGFPFSLFRCLADVETRPKVDRNYL